MLTMSYAGEPVEVAGSVAGFVGAEQDRRAEPGQSASALAGSGCSIISTPSSCQRPARGAREARNVQPSLASTISRAAGAALRTAPTRSTTQSLPTLIFTSNGASAPCLDHERRGVGRHCFRIAERDRQRRAHGAGRRNPGKFPRAPAACFAARSHSAQSSAVARRAGREDRLQVRRVETGGDRLRESLDRGDDAGDALAVAGVRDALAATDAVLLRDLDDNRLGGRLGSPGDGEGAAQRPGLGSNPQRPGHDAQAVDQRSDAGKQRIDARQAQIVGDPVEAIPRLARPDSAALTATPIQRTRGLVSRAASRLPRCTPRARARAGVASPACGCGSAHGTSPARPLARRAAGRG